MQQDSSEKYGEMGRLLKMVYLDVWILLFEVSSHSGDGASGSDARDKGGDLASGAFPYLRPCGLVVDLLKRRNSDNIK